MFFPKKPRHEETGADGGKGERGAGVAWKQSKGFCMILERSHSR